MTTTRKRCRDTADKKRFFSRRTGGQGDRRCPKKARAACLPEKKRKARYRRLFYCRGSSRRFFESDSAAASKRRLRLFFSAVMRNCREGDLCLICGSRRCRNITEF